MTISEGRITYRTFKINLTLEKFIFSEFIQIFKKYVSIKSGGHRDTLSNNINRNNNAYL